MNILCIRKSLDEIQMGATFFFGFVLDFWGVLSNVCDTTMRQKTMTKNIPRWWKEQRQRPRRQQEQRQQRRTSWYMIYSTTMRKVEKGDVAFREAGGRRHRTSWFLPMNSMCGGSRKCTYSHDNDSWPSEIPSRSGSIRMGPNRARPSFLYQEKRCRNCVQWFVQLTTSHALLGPKKVCLYVPHQFWKR